MWALARRNDITSPVYSSGWVTAARASRHWPGRVERVLVVDCAEATQVERVVARNGWTVEAVERVIAQQASRSARRAVADAVIFNDGLTLEALREQVRTLWRHWIGPVAAAAAR